MISLSLLMANAIEKQSGMALIIGAFYFNSVPDLSWYCYEPKSYNHMKKPKQTIYKRNFTKIQHSFLSERRTRKFSGRYIFMSLKKKKTSLRFY